MLSIRLSRIGKKKQPVYRVVVCEKSKDPWGNCLEILGHYNPRSNPKTAELKADRIRYWIEKGAQPSDTVRNILIDQKVIEGEKVTASKLSKKRQAKIEEKKKEEAEKAAAAEEKPEEPAKEAEAAESKE